MIKGGKKMIENKRKNLSSIDVYYRLDDVITEILRKLGNTEEDYYGLCTNIDNAIRKLKVIKRLVKKNGFDDEDN